MLRSPRLQPYSQEWTPDLVQAPMVPPWEPVVPFPQWPYPYTGSNDADFQHRNDFINETSLQIFGDRGDELLFPPYHNNSSIFNTRFSSYLDSCTPEALKDMFDFTNVDMSQNFKRGMLQFKSDDPSVTAYAVTKHQMREACRNILIHKVLTYETNKHSIIHETTKNQFPVSSILFDYVDDDNYHSVTMQPWYDYEYTIEPDIRDPLPPIPYSESQPLEYWHIFLNCHFKVKKKEGGTLTVLKEDTLRRCIWMPVRHASEIIPDGGDMGSGTHLSTYRAYFNWLELIVSVQYCGRDRIQVDAVCMPHTCMKSGDAMNYVHPRGTNLDGTGEEEEIVDAQGKILGSWRDTPQDYRQAFYTESGLYDSNSGYSIAGGSYSLGSYWEHTWKAHFHRHSISLTTYSTPNYGTKIGFGLEQGTSTIPQLIEGFTAARLYYVENDSGEFVHPSDITIRSNPLSTKNGEITSGYGPMNASEFNTLVAGTVSTHVQELGEPPPYSNADLNADASTYSAHAPRPTSTFIADYAWQHYGSSFPPDDPIFLGERTSYRSYAGSHGFGEYPISKGTEPEQLVLQFNSVNAFAGQDEWGYNQTLERNTHPDFDPANKDIWWSYINSIGVDQSSIWQQPGPSLNISSTAHAYFNTTPITLNRITEDDHYANGMTQVGCRGQRSTYWHADLSGESICDDAVWHTRFFSDFDGQVLDIGTLTYQFKDILLYPVAAYYGADKRASWELRLFLDVTWNGMPSTFQYLNVGPLVRFPVFYIGFNGDGSASNGNSGNFDNSQIIKRTTLELSMPFESNLENDVWDHGQSIGLIGYKDYNSDDCLWPAGVRPLRPEAGNLPAYLHYGLSEYRAPGCGIPYPRTLSVCDFKNCGVTIRPADPSFRDSFYTADWNGLLKDELPDNELTNPGGIDAAYLDRPVY